MTWLEFKQEVERYGVTDQMSVGWIDVHLPEAPLKIAINEEMLAVCTDHPEKVVEFSVS